MIRYLLITAALMAATVQPLCANKSNGNSHQVPKLSLNAEASLKKPADQLRMRIGVVTTGETAEQALQDNSKKMEAVIKALNEAGLASGDYETGHFSITPTYTPYPKDATPSWRPSINGYEVRNTLLIHSADIGAAGKLIDVSNQAGANTIDDIHFALSDPRIYSDEAVSLALANAVHDAKVIAKEADVTLVQILSINVDHSSAAPMPVTMYMAKGAGFENSPPIEAGDVTLTARVSIVYEISSK